MAKSGKWETVGEFKKTKRQDVLVGHIMINDIKVRVLAFIKTKEQKRSKGDPDLVILMPKETDDNTPPIPDSLFE